MRRNSLTWLLSVCSLLFVGRPIAILAAEPLSQGFRADSDLGKRCLALGTADLSGIVDAPAQVTSAIMVAGNSDVPAYCKVVGYVASEVGLEIALPMAWNGKFMEGGSGGHGGMLEKLFAWSCGAGVRRGYACIISDMGHTGSGTDGLWAEHNLQAKLDWGYRATHVAAVAGKAITARFYGHPPSHSYYAGCSTGGRQGLQEVQRFPWDFDGVIAGAPPVNLSTLYMTFAWGVRSSHDASGNPLLGDRELKLLTSAAVKKCDIGDGARDGIIGDPLDCSFDPADLACRAGTSGDCLTPQQIQAARKLYAGPMTSAGEKLSPGGPLPGSEDGPWRDYYLGTVAHGPYAELFAESGFRYLFFWPAPGETWKIKDFDFDRDYRRMGLMEALVDASNPDLRKFKATGGRLLVYQGLNDLSVLPRSTIDYYETVERTMGGREATQSFFRLFLLPGVEHCGSGPGADVVDYLSYLEDWVERDRPPAELLAAHLKDRGDLMHAPQFPLDPQTVAFTRPVYPYPTRAVYKGRGDPNSASSFAPR